MVVGAGYTRILYNLFREIGVWEKQSSAFFQAKAAESHLQGNVVFNLARAGFNVRRHACCRQAWDVLRWRWR